MDLVRAGRPTFVMVAATLAFELGFPLALVSKRARLVLVPTTVAMNERLLPRPALRTADLSQSPDLDSLAPRGEPGPGPAPGARAGGRAGEVSIDPPWSPASSADEAANPLDGIRDTRKIDPLRLGGRSEVAR